MAESEIADVITQGKSRAGAAFMLADAIESLADLPKLKVTVRDMPSVGDDAVAIESSDPAALVAFVLRRQRVARGLSLAQVAELLGQRSRTAYARYERGTVMPSIEKFEELLRALTPNAAIVIGTRAPAKTARVQARPSRRSRAAP